MMTNKKQRFFLILMIFCTLLTIGSARTFDLDQDRGLAVAHRTISKEIDGKTVSIMRFHLFILEQLENQGIEISGAPEETVAFLIPEVLNLSYFSETGRDTFEVDYNYTPFWGYLTGEDNYVETFLYFRDEMADFGGRSYCPDCGEPMACGTRILSLSRQNPIWFKNPWIDFKKGYKLDLLWFVEGEELAIVYQKE